MAVVDRAVADKALTDERTDEGPAAEKTAAEKSVMESAGPGSTLASAVGSKRAVTLSNSTPSQKWFRGAWK
jgi:hypothetical protein